MRQSGVPNVDAGVAAVAGLRHRRDVHAGVTGGALLPVVRLLRAGVLAVVARLAGRRRRVLTAVMRAAAGVDERDARLVAVQALLAVPGRTEVRVESVGERRDVVDHPWIPQVTLLAAGQARRREVARVLPGIVARPALIAGVALEAEVAEAGAGRVVGLGAGVAVDAPGGAVVLPAVEGRGGRGGAAPERLRPPRTAARRRRRRRRPTAAMHASRSPPRRRHDGPVAPLMRPLAGVTVRVNRTPTR